MESDGEKIIDFFSDHITPPVVLPSLDCKPAEAQTETHDARIIAKGRRQNENGGDSEFVLVWSDW